jgi:Glycosyltransferase family 87
VRPRLAVAAGLGVLALVAGCVAVSWPDDSKLVPRHGGHPVGASLWSWLFLGFACAAFLLYVGGLALLRRSGRLRVVLALAVAIQVAPLAAPLLISTDAWTYWDYGRLAAVHGANPYVANPDDVPDDPAFRWVGTGWWDTSSVYGPAFTLASEPLALADGGSAPAAAWTYKVLAAACMVAIVLLVSRLTGSAFAVAFAGWNPLLALHLAGGGHNDAWMAALVVAALGAAAAGRRQLAGAAWALAILVKWVPLLFLVLRAAEARATKREVAHVGFGAAAAVVLALATWRYGYHWVDAFGPLARNANRESRFAIPHRLGGHPAALVFAGLFVLAYAWLLREAWRGRARLGLCAGLLLVATPWLVPWYAVWAIPLAAVEEDATAKLLALGFSGYLLRQAIPL